VGYNLSALRACRTPRATAMAVILAQAEIQFRISIFEFRVGRIVPLKPHEEAHS